MRMLIIVPVATGLSDPFAYPPMGPLMIAGALDRSGYECHIRYAILSDDGQARYGMDEDLSRYTGPESLNLNIYNFVGVNIFAEATFDTAAAIIKDVPLSKWLIAGGAFVTSAGEETLKTGVDIGVIDEGEETIVELLNVLRYYPKSEWHDRCPPDLAFIKGIIYREEPLTYRTTPHRGYGYEMDDLAYPKWDAIRPNLVARETHAHLAPGRKQTTVFATRGCPFNCFTGDTMVALPDKLYRPDEQEYEQAFTCGEPGHVHKLGKDDQRLLYQGKRDTLKIALANGLELKVTHEHPVSVVRNEAVEFVEAHEIKPGDHVVTEIGQNDVKNLYRIGNTETGDLNYNSNVGRSKKAKLPTHVNSNLAWLLGYLIGDGSIPKDNRPCIHFVISPKIEHRLKAIVKILFGLTLKEYAASNTDKIRHGWLNSIVVHRMITETLGIKPDNKHRVPDCILRSPARIVEAFLDGLYDADGYVDKKGVKYLTTINKRLAVECAALLHWTGSVATVKTYKLRDGVAYRVYWYEANSRIHTGQLTLYEAVPIPYRLYRSKKTGVLHKRTNIDKSRRYVNRAMLEEYDPSHPLLNPAYLYTEVKVVTNNGVQDVYDAVNAPTHTLAGNGVHIHNCTFCNREVGGRKFRMHSVDYILRHLNKLRNEYGITHVRFPDDLFTTNKKWVLTMSRAIGNDGFTWVALSRTDTLDDEMAQAMSEGGCKGLFFGIESGSARILSLMRKKTTPEGNAEAIERCRKYGMTSSTYFIFGFPGKPGENGESIKETLDWLTIAKPDRAHYSTFLPIHGTDPYRNPGDYAIEIKPGYRNWVYYDSPDFPVEYLSPNLNNHAMAALREYFEKRLELLGYMAWKERASVNQPEPI